MDEKGTYIGVRYDEQSMERIVALANVVGFPNPLHKGMLHSTLIYSTEFLPVLTGGKEVEYEAWMCHLKIWPTDRGNILVLILKSPAMETRHQQWLNRGAKHSYDDYAPHITLSYNVGDWTIPSWYEIPKFRLTANWEYVEELKLDWGKK